MKKFGRTWWGELWLNAFQGIDYSNRLPRGRGYAKPDRVLNLNISDGVVKAEVQGRRRSPYKVSISLKPIGTAQRQRLLDAIKDNPHAIGELLNGILPEHVYELAQQNEIELLPSAWSSVNGRCSCPDWAVPCKHLAAVVYLLSIEIDKDPFLIFRLHGIDLLSDVRTLTNVSVERAALSPNPLLEQATTSDEKSTSLSTLHLLDIDLSIIPDLGEQIFGLLDKEPLFYEKDFHAELETRYRRTARSVTKLNAETIEHPKQIRDFNGETLLLDDTCGFRGVFNRSGKRAFETIDAWIEDLATVRSFGAGAVNEGDSHAVFWYVLYRFALVLLERRAYVPRVLAYAPNEAVIGWRAALIDPSVTKTIDQLYACCPADLVHVEYKTSKARRRRKLDQQAQVDMALNVLLTYFIKSAFGTRTSTNTNELIQQWFFTGALFRFDWFGVADTPLIVQRWLNCLSLRDRNHQILLFVEESDAGRQDDLDTSEDDISKVVQTDGLISLDVKIQIRDEIHTLADIFAEDVAAADDSSIISDLAFLASYLPDLEKLLRSRGSLANSKIEYSLADFAPILLKSLPILELLGVKLVLPKSLSKLLRPQIRLNVSQASGGAISYVNLEDLVSFDWQIALGDEKIPLEAFEQLVESVAGLVRIRDQYVLLDHDEVESIAKRIEKLPDSFSPFDMLKGHLSDGIDEIEVDFDQSIKSFLEDAVQAKQLAKPKQLTAELRKYQQYGFEWLANNARMGFGSILADDMGLGKTVQVIALLLHQKELGELKESSALVVVPTSLLTNWRKEIERFAGSLLVHTYYGPQRKLPEKHCDVMLASYGVVRSDIAMLSKRKFHTLIIDEAQNIKNPLAQQTRAIKKISANVRIALSGTPVENRLLDYWSIFDFAMRGYLGTKNAFTSKVAKPIEMQRDQACLDRFRKQTSPFILRRLKTNKEIISDLPEKIESDRFCTLTPTQASLYQNAVDAISQSLEDAETPIERQGALFKLVMALKQICNAPSQYLKRSYEDSEESGKLALFVDILGEALDANEKVIIFTQFTQMGDILVECVKSEFGMELPFLHGQLTRKQRDEKVDAFQNDSRTRAMVLSLKAGGTGLNLTAANQVIHYDLWWNPAVETQATDRAYRIGQTKNVLVHRLLTENTFEERINEMIRGKRELAELTVTDGEMSISDLSNDEIRELVALQ